jgi:hypothetical protein
MLSTKSNSDSAKRKIKRKSEKKESNKKRKQRAEYEPLTYYREYKGPRRPGRLRLTPAKRGGHWKKRARSLPFPLSFAYIYSRVRPYPIAGSHRQQLEKHTCISIFLYNVL